MFSETSPPRLPKQSGGQVAARRFIDNVKLGKLTWGINTRIEPIGFTPEEFESRLLAQEIKKKGLKIPITNDCLLWLNHNPKKFIRNDFFAEGRPENRDGVNPDKHVRF